MSQPILLRASGLGKTYGALRALKHASIELKRGEVRALVGANGAGKSTLIKILTGATRPTTGEITVDGQRIETGDPGRMMKAGIACIYQHSNLVPAMSVLDNIFLGRQPTRRWGILDRKRQRADATALLKRYAIDLDLDAEARDLPPVKQKEVEIAKALALDAQVLLMDEPTAWLSQSEVKRLFQTIRTLKAEGVGIIYISHFLDEIYEISDNMTVLRDGGVVADCATADMSRTELLRKFIGERLADVVIASATQPKTPRARGEAKLICRNLRKTDVFEGISFDLFAGEILCVTGLIGSKRTEMVRTLFGADSLDGGTVTLGGKDYRPANPSAAVAMRIGFVPEDRRRDGLMMSMSIEQNLMMVSLASVTKFGVLGRRSMRALAAAQMRALNILPNDASIQLQKLSGGNQQKTLIGRWLQTDPEVLILDEPTVGVDVGAKAEIYEILHRLASDGRAILVVSSDIEEVQAIADRIMVMRDGRVEGIYDAHGLTSGELLAHIGGVR